jgi:multiple antibiotic resistance protein
MTHPHGKDFWLCFVPLFVAVDALGTLPIFTALVGSAKQSQITRLIKTSIVTALLVALPFIFLGKWLFMLLGITVADFMIAGGIILLLLSTRDLLATKKQSYGRDLESLGPVPLGVPLIVGPAVLTTIMLLVGQYGFFMTTAATIINILIAGAVFYFTKGIIRIMGRAGTQIASKVSSLFLAAIAIMLIRKGVIAILKNNFLFW